MNLLTTSFRHGVQRREFLRHLFWTAGAIGSGSLMARVSAQTQPTTTAGPGPGLSVTAPGPLRAPDANGLMLPAGWVSRVVAVSGEKPLSGASYVWHASPDGGATFTAPNGGWVYASNSEAPWAGGGVGALRFDKQGRVSDAYPLLTGTTLNCAGGPTPWGTWLSAEEFAAGRVWECYPFGTPADARPLAALGIFKHEAVAVDPVHKIVYLTEDERTGRFYRFVCAERDWPAGASRPQLRDGALQVLRFKGQPDSRYPDRSFEVMWPNRVEWVDVVSPELLQASVRDRLGDRAPGSIFMGGEGLWFFKGVVYFATKGDNRIWAYDHGARSLEAIYDFERAGRDDAVLAGVDNLTVAPSGAVLVAEDGGNMELCTILPNRSVRVLLRVTGQDGSEITGPAFSPDGSRLYFSSQRGGRRGAGEGITYEVCAG